MKKRPFKFGVSQVEQQAKMTFKWVNESIEDCQKQMDIEVFGYDRDADVDGIMEYFVNRFRLHEVCLCAQHDFWLMEGETMSEVLENAGY